MKKLLVILLALFIAVPTFAQVKLGVKAGLSTTSITMTDIKTITTTTNPTTYTIDALEQANYGFHAGLFLRMSLLGIYLQPEIVFASTVNEYNVSTTAATVVKSQTFNKLDIPVLLGFKLGPIRINAGPAASVLINSPAALIDNPDLENLYARTTFGYQAGIGVDLFKKLTIDLRYEGSLKKYQNQIQNLAGTTTINLDDRPNAFLLSAGLIF